MTNRPLTRCNECHAEFTPAFYEEQQTEGGIKITFLCPKCSHRYDVAYLPERAVEVRAELNRLRDERNPKANRERIRELQAEYQSLYVGLANKPA